MKELKNIGIITFHFANNYGAFLQCYALQTKLSALGFCVSVIDYRPSYHAVKYSAWKNPFTLAYNSWLKHQNKKLVRRIQLWLRAFARGLLANLLGTDRKEARVFRLFIGKTLHLTRRYPTLRSLRKDPPPLDVYICGSDQVWNPDLMNGSFDLAYFLDFGVDKIRRVAYAVSIKKTLDSAQTSELASLFWNLDAISLREENETVNTILGHTVQICVDPTLLIDAYEFENILAAPPMAGSYIFVYGMETTDEMQSAVADVAEALQLSVINGSPARVRLTIPAKSVRDYTPGEFLAYVKNASFVVTNSFHGTIFSIIYQKSFFTVPHSTRGNRMVELLHKLDLGDRLLLKQQICEDTCLAKINYDHVREKLVQLREESLKYLLESLNY